MSPRTASLAGSEKDAVMVAEKRDGAAARQKNSAVTAASEG
jgi:hypothetical protein